MLAVAIALFTLAWAFGLTYMIRYPERWGQFIDRQHLFLARYGWSGDWMRWIQRAEKGLMLKLIVGATVVIALACLAVLSKHPGALQVFLQSWGHPHRET